MIQDSHGAGAGTPGVAKPDVSKDCITDVRMTVSTVVAGRRTGEDD